MDGINPKNGENSHMAERKIDKKNLTCFSATDSDLQSFCRLKKKREKVEE